MDAMASSVERTAASTAVRPQDAKELGGSPASSTKEQDLEKNLQAYEVPPSTGDTENTEHVDYSATKEQSSNLVDYDGEDDPQNPYNWTKGRKWANGGLVSAMTFVSPLASSMFAPGVPEVLDEFGVSSSTLGSLVVSIYVLGYAFGPLIIAPLSEIYGRTPLYHVANVLFCVFTVACAVSSSLGMLIGFRFLAGMMGSTPLTIGGGTIADMFRTEERGAAMAIWSIGPLLGPVIGPIAGSYLTEALGWRWNFWLITILAGIVTIGMFVFLRETYAPFILERKARNLRKETGNTDLRSKLDLGLTPMYTFKRAIVRPLKMLMFSPMVFFLSLYMAIVYGYLYLLFTTMTRVFEDTYQFSKGSVGLAYLGIGIGMFSGLFVAGVTSDIVLKKLKSKNNGVAKPEFRLPPMIPAGVLIPIGLFIYGWTAQYGVHWIVPIIGTGFVGFGLITIFMPISTYLIDAYTLYAASAMAANTVLRSFAGALLPLAGPKMYDALGLGWGNSLLGFIALALVPLPVFFYKYGERIRTSPRFAIQL